MPESLGRYLRRERQMRDVSLEQIARETKITLPILEALENDRFETLPSPAIVKGFLRAYAQIVGLSENGLVLRYESILEERGLSPHGPGSLRQRLPGKPRRLAPVIWLLLVVLGLGVGLRLLDRGPGSPVEEAGGVGGADDVVYRKNYLRELSTDASPGTPAHLGSAGREEAEAGGGIHLLLRASVPLTVRVVLDDRESETLALIPGQPVARYASRGALVEAARPGPLLLEANGRPVATGQAVGGPILIFLTPLEPDSAPAADEAALPLVGARVVLPGAMAEERALPSEILPLD
ncbi:MAG: helix-turn-helix transcriptional regulator [Deltaproteobacteria bacterium]|nr:helix-turn-helix transcriptional regulator [Deltaproteobacteria bacterium]